MESFFKWLAGGGFVTVFLVAVYAGSLTADVQSMAEEMVDDSEFAKVQQQLEDHLKEFEKVERDVQEIKDDSARSVEILERMERRANPRGHKPHSEHKQIRYAFVSQPGAHG